MTAPTLFQIDTGKSALISPCGRYRYRLERTWSDKPRACWIMLNPSTADAEHDDNTIRRVVDFTHGWCYGGLIVVNLFALRSTSPAVLHDDPAAAIGPENDARIIEAVEQCRRVVVAWGIHGPLARRDKQVLRLLKNRQLHCLGLTSGGHPRHPLFISGATQLIPFPN